MKALFKIGNSEELNPSQAILLMELGETHCCFAIVDFANQMMVQLGYYTMDEKDDDNSLQTVLEAHPELKQSFRQTIVSYYLPESMLIPAKFYRYEETQKMLATMYQEGSNTVVSESIGEWQVYNAYRIPSGIHVLEQLGIRTMAKAKYATENIGHYGLGFENYCHFTSPIRRYPDVMVHRVLQQVLEKNLHIDKKAEEKCKHCSERERAAMALAHRLLFLPRYYRKICRPCFCDCGCYLPG